MIPETIRCAGCGVEIIWSALVQRSPGSPRPLYYCCKDCLDGLECSCAARMEDEDRRESAGVPGSWPG